MASVNWEKFKSVQRAKAVMRHDCKDTREACEQHTNEHLQSALTPENSGVWDKYGEASKRYDDRMAELPPPGRKDAVVGLGFSIPAPADLPKDREEEWFARVLDLMGEHYGLENIACYAIHRDEVHDYIDPDTGKTETSRIHAQGVLIPESDGRLCAKDVTARWRMTAINNAIHQMTEKEFGLQWMDGSKAKSRGNVEQMKNRSLKAENQRLREENAKLQKQVEGFLAPVKAFRAKHKTDKEQRADEAEARLADAEQARATAEAAAAAAEARQRAAEDALQEAEALRLENEKAAQEAAEARQRAESRVGLDLVMKKAELQTVEQQLRKVFSGKDDRAALYALRATGQYERFAEKGQQLISESAREQVKKQHGMKPEAPEKRQRGHDEMEL